MRVVEALLAAGADVDCMDLQVCFTFLWLVLLYSCAPVYVCLSAVAEHTPCSMQQTHISVLNTYATTRVPVLLVIMYAQWQSTLLQYASKQNCAHTHKMFSLSPYSCMRSGKAHRSNTPASRDMHPSYGCC